MQQTKTNESNQLRLKLRLSNQLNQTLHAEATAKAKTTNYGKYSRLKLKSSRLRLSDRQTLRQIRKVKTKAKATN